MELFLNAAKSWINKLYKLYISDTYIKLVTFIFIRYLITLYTNTLQSCYENRRFVKAKVARLQHENEVLVNSVDRIFSISCSPVVYNSFTLKSKVLTIRGCDIMT